MKTTPGDLIRQEFTFTAVPDGALQDKRVTRQAFMVYVVLCHHADRRGENAFPGLNTIAREARCGKTSVVKAIQDLVRLGYVKKEKRTVAGKQEFSATLYTITAKRGSPVRDYGSPTQDHGGSPVQDPNYIPSSYLDPLNHTEAALPCNATGNGALQPKNRDAAYLPLAEELAAAVKKILPRQPCKPAGWARDIRLLIECDHATAEEVRQVLVWLPAAPSNNGFCWAKVVLSGAKLRKHFARLLLEVNRNGSGQPVGESAEQAAAALFGRGG